MIKFRSVLNEDAANKLNSHEMRKLAIMEVVLCVSFVLAGIAFILIDETGLGIFLTIFGLLFPVMIALIVKQKQKSMNKSAAILNGQTEQEFEFFDDHYTVKVNSGDMYNAVATARYYYLFRIVETKTHYFLYISETQAEVVDKSGLTEGTIEELNDILARNLDSKFKPYKGK